MKLRAWILEGTEKDGKPMRILTTPDAGRDVAWRKFCFKIPAKYRCFVGLRRGGIVEV